MRSLRDVRPTGNPIFVAVLTAGSLGLAFGAGISCSPDVTGLGNFDGGAAGRPGGGTGGTAGRGAGGSGGTAGRPGSGTGGTAGTAGRSGSGTGGTAGRSGSGTGGSAGHVGAGGMTSTGTGGAVVGTGGATSSGGAGGTAAGGAIGTGGRPVGTGGARDTGVGGQGVGGATGGSAGRGAGGGANGTGGRGAGGRGGGRGGRGGDGTGGSPADPECTDASDCRLDSDCCACEAVPASSPPMVSCALECLQSHCSALHLPADAVACVAGRCVAGFACDDARVTCRIAVPNCSQGQVPGVTESGECYTGSCVPAAQCTSVAGCSACAPGEACVLYQTQLGNQYHCVSIPASCNKDQSCDCLGPSVCTGSFSSCSNLSGQRAVMCSCPTC
jgi:hypothetical protein